MYLVFAILIFSYLIFIHELGHFIAAKAFGVRVNEFSIFMGPRLLHWGKGETEYSLRLLPIGGFCAMEGEDGNSDDPRSFHLKPKWQRAIILAAGAFMNFLSGILILVIVFSASSGFRTTEITGFIPGNAMEEQGLQVGDTIHAIDGKRILIYSDFAMLTDRADSTEMDLTVLRDGEKVLLENISMEKRLLPTENGEQMLYGFMMGAVEENSLITTLKYSLYSAWDFGRMVLYGLVDLVTGTVGLRDMSGPVGIVDTIQETGKAAETTGDGILNVLYFGAFIAVNLAFMNMLPIPALDGGHIFFLVVTWIIESITKKKIDPKYEAYIHGAGLVLLMGLMLLVTFNDIFKLFVG